MFSNFFTGTPFIKATKIFELFVFEESLNLSKALNLYVFPGYLGDNTSERKETQQGF